MAAAKGEGSPVWAQPSQLGFVSGPYLRCPNCNSTDLKKVSLAYKEGLFHIDTHTRLRALAVGGSGPDFVVGKATTRGFHQSVVSKQLNPPVKWSYRKLFLWWALVSLCSGWIIFYINTITRSSSAVFAASVDSFFAVICRHVITLAGSLLDSQSIRLQASVFTVGTLVRLSTLRRFNGAGIAFH